MQEAAAPGPQKGRLKSMNPGPAPKPKRGGVPVARVVLTALALTTWAGAGAAVPAEPDAQPGASPAPAPAGEARPGPAKAEPPNVEVTRPETARDPLTQAALDDEELAPVVKARLRLAYLTEVERRAIRIRHGVWGEGDLTAASDRAMAALDRGVYDDASLKDGQAPAALRAQAALGRGEPEAALELVKGETSLAARLVRVRALLDLGRRDDALTEGAPALRTLNEQGAASADDVVSAVRIAALLADLRQPGRDDDHQAMIAALGRARTLDPLDYRVRLAEAELLFDKDNYDEAQAAIREALKLNPSSAESWAVLGHMAVNGFNLPEAEKIAKMLDRLASMEPRSAIMDGAEAAGEDGGGEEREDDHAEAPADGARPARPAAEARAVSALAAGVRARALLRQDDPEGAGAALAPALDRFAGRRDLREYAIAVSALRYDWEATHTLLDEYDRLSPGSARGYYEAGRALADSRQYAQAAKWLGEAFHRAPAWAAPAAELGLLEVQSGRDQEALIALERAEQLDPYNVRVGNSLKLMREIQTYERTETSHFVIRSRAGIDTLLAREMVPVLEEMYAIVCGDRPGGLDHSPAGKTVIELMPDHAWFAVRIAGLPRIHTIAASTGPVIAMEVPREGRGHKGAYDWQRVVRHEYTHTVGLSRTGNRIPHWFTEANAVYLELAPRDYSTIELLQGALESDALFDFTEINIAFTRPKKPSDRAQAYAQGHWMFQYLVETYGREAPLKLMDRYAQGTREEEAFQQVLGVSRADFMDAFKTWATKQLRAWGMTPPEGEPSLADLWKQEDKRREAADEKPENPDEATPELIARWLKDHPKHPEVLELAVRKLLAQDDEPEGDQAVALLKQYAAARPVDPLPVRHLARIALGAPNRAEAIPYLEWLDAREQYTAVYAAQLATLYADEGQWDQARVKAERATRVAPFTAQHRELAAAIALNMGDRAGARRHIEFLIALEPDREIHKRRLEALDKATPGTTGGGQ